MNTQGVTSANPDPDKVGFKPDAQGKVRDIYDMAPYGAPDQLVLVATDRISAFDHVLPDPIPNKGIVLTKVSEFWLREVLGGIIANHFISTDLVDFPAEFIMDKTSDELEWLRGRAMLVRKATVFPVECIVRGYLAGSGWKEYLKTGTVCGIRLPAGLRECAKLPRPIFTPSTKAELGDHDENISFERMSEIVGHDVATALRDKSLAVFNSGMRVAESGGIIIADTKFEFGDIDGEVTLIDEVLTPDSSRFWPADSYEPGHDQSSFDKQYVRNWLENESGWDKQSPPPRLPEEIIEGTALRYFEAYEKLTGFKFCPKHVS